MRRRLACLFFAAFCGCAAKPKEAIHVYPADAGRPDLATLTAKNNFLITTVVQAVDGLAVDYGGVLLWSDTGKPIEVRPGPHTIRTRVDAGQQYTLQTFPLELKAGHAYTLENAGAFDMHIKVTDKTDGSVQVMTGDGPM